MPYYEKKILRDAQNIPIPQYWDPVADEFKPMTKEVVLSGSCLREQLTDADAVANVLTFSENITAIEIFHESVYWQEFIVNGLTITVPAGGYRTPVGGTPSMQVTIPVGVPCIVGRLE